MLRPAKAAALRAAVTALAKQGGFTHKESDLFSLAQTADFADTTNKTLAEFRAFLRSPEWTAYLRTLTGVALTGLQLDSGASLYLDKDYLLCHDDQVTGRKIAYIFYLGPNFTARDGGALALLDTKSGKPGAVVKRLAPQYNTLVMFTVSSKSWHAVEEVTSAKPRISINGWFH
jgi:Rps23 Pro-64 3,4-dihydroxylase Tpa1-like proline 4-hydroxylase